MKTAVETIVCLFLNEYIQKLPKLFRGITDNLHQKTHFTHDLYYNVNSENISQRLSYRY